jgi:hypothetical protein
MNHGYSPHITAALSKLPKSAHEIISIVGESAALVLFEKIGGTHFPMVKGHSKLGHARLSVLGDYIGEHLAQKLCAHYGNTETLYIPLCSNALRFIRDLRIKQRFDELVRERHSGTQAVNLLVAQYRLCDRTIWRILKTPDVLDGLDNGQDGLF